MADLIPFRAWRPRPGLESRIASYPYDVVSTAEAALLAEENDLSFLRVVRSEIDLPAGTDPHHPSVYEKARVNLHNLMEHGRLVREANPAFYLYAQTMGSHRQVGIVGGASVAEYEQGAIKRHEHTRRDKEDDRTRHIAVTNANTGPVFLTYRAVAAIDRMVARLTQSKPLYHFTAEDGIGHEVWVIDGPKDIAGLRELLAAIPALYVADGHHRTASAARVGRERRAALPAAGRQPFDHFLAVVFPHDQLRILDYNRVVLDLAGLSNEAFLKAIDARFEISETPQKKPGEPKRFGMYLDGSWYCLTARPGSYPTADPVGSLDVAVLQANLFAPILGIDDPRTSTRIDFIGGIRGPEELERRVDQGAAVAFTLFPTSIQQLMAVADAGLVMPPKSTWFEPKLRSGLLIKTLDSD
ncbi:DUF1015 domain-containing protein [bacterium]|nr:DUF1015 domain-containing protein [candidate division CSSED10-310 bacterium]